MYDMTLSYVWHAPACVLHDSFICATVSVAHKCRVISSCEQQRLWHIYVYAMTAAQEYPIVLSNGDCGRYIYVIASATIAPGVWHVALMYVAWLVHIYDTAHSYVCFNSLTCVKWLMYLGDMAHSHAWHDAFMCVTGLIHKCDMNHSYVWHDSFMFTTRLSFIYALAPVAPKCSTSAVTAPSAWYESSMCAARLAHTSDSCTRGKRLIHTCDMTHWGTLILIWFVCVWHDLFVSLTCLVHVCGMTHLYVLQDSFTRVT